MVQVYSWVNQMLETIADLGRHYLESPAKQHSLNSLIKLCHTLIKRRGEASGTALAKEIVDSIHKLSDHDKVKFLQMLATDFAPDSKVILKAAESYIENQDYENLKSLNAAIESPRLELLRFINIAPGGIAMIIALREKLLVEIKKYRYLEPVETDMFHLLTSWFNRGFLTFQQIDWETPAMVLEKLIEYEAVHEIQGWKDLRRRLADDRSCFAFFHPALPEEPLIFVEVAYTKGIARKIQPLLSQKEDTSLQTTADTAIFYSISNCQEGLRGISMGNFLIKQVVDSITAQTRQIKNFCTLSPIPRFTRWIQEEYLAQDDDLMTKAEIGLLSDMEWVYDNSIRKRLKNKLLKLCARYLYQEKKRNRPIDPVTRFHLGNGAEIEAINWDADVSDSGLKQSAGLMVNYRYNPSKIVANHEAYTNEGKISTSSQVKKLLD